MKACKQWDETLQNNPICVPPDSVQKHETAPSGVHQQPENAAHEVHHEDTTNEESRQNEEAQQVISNVLVQMVSEGKTFDFKLTHANLCKKSPCPIHMQYLKNTHAIS
ncbi:hypothetical protein Hanom_Chr01g00024101 [Helianthus anomalus]